MKILFLLLLLVTSAAQAQSENDILYVVPNKDNSRFQIHAMDVVSGDHREIGRISNRRSDAGWSPDGRYIYIVDYVSENSRILKLVEFESSESQIITEQVRVDDCAAYLSWSPDSRFLAYQTEQGDEILLHVLDTQHNQTRRLPDTVMLNPWLFWSPDSRFLAAAVQPESVLLWDLKADEINTTLASDGYSNLSWSPDARYITYTPLDDDAVIEVLDLTNEQAQRYPGYRVGRWSPDGRYLVFYQRDENDNPQPFILDTQEDRVFPLGDESANAGFMGWSPDSRYVAYAIRHPQTQTLHVLDLTTNETEELISIPYIQRSAWSPVDKVIAFVSSPDQPKGDSTHLMVIDADTGSSAQFEANVADVIYDQPLRWSANGQNLAVYLHDGISIYDRASQQLQPVTETLQNVLPPRWSADGRYLSVPSFTPDKLDIYVIDTRENLQLYNVTQTPDEDETFIGWRGSNDNRSLIYCGIG